MWIVFDLDDTLIDTSGSVTPFKLGEALRAMEKAGLVSGPGAMEELVALNRVLPKTSASVRQFALKRGGGEAVVAAGLEALSSPLPDDFRVVLRPGAKEILDYCRTRHTTALVTMGYAPFQREKFKKAGLDESLFSTIAIPSDSIKKSIFQSLAERWKAPPREVVVIGDRIDLDLEPARELGFITVHVRWGRGQQVATPDWVNHSIAELSELMNIL